MQLSAYCEVLAMFATSGTLSDAAVDNLYSCIRSMMWLIILLICDQLPRGGVAQALRLQPITSSANKTETVKAVRCYTKTTANKNLTHTQNQM